MKRGSVIWSDEAIADLGEAWDYIARDNEPAADRTIEKIETAADSLARFPLLGRTGR